ncbi:hypothetical protein CR513_32588, partial [Mucuna pruriens]
MQTNPQVYGMPTPPIGAADASNTFPSPHSHSKPDNTVNTRYPASQRWANLRLTTFFYCF